MKRTSTGASEPTIVCTHCGREMKLTETIAAPLIATARAKLAAEGKQRDEILATRERTIKEATTALARGRASLDEEIETRLEAERQALSTKAAETAREEQAAEMQSLRDELEEKKGKIGTGQKSEIELRKKLRAAEDKAAEMDLQKEVELAQERTKVKQATEKELAERQRLKAAENQIVIDGLKGTIDDLKRKVEQGSQQLQGEAQELDLEQMLRTAFPRDTIDEVPKGQHGGDCIHRVVDGGGAIAGTILWESKRTKKWSDPWLPKLRTDQRTARADIAVLVTAVLPKEIERFGLMDGVWVTDLASAVPLTMALRHSILEINAARTAGEGRQTKMELLYRFLCGPEFRHRIEAVVEAYETMRTDLEAEKRAIMKHWGKREKQLNLVLQSTVMMYGEFQAIAGASLPAIQGLELPALEAGAEAEEKDESAAS